MIAISLLDTDILRLEEKAADAVMAGVDYIHLDFGDMDVLPATLVPNLCDSLRSSGVTCPIEVRLPRNVTVNAIAHICQSGADWIFIEPEMKELNSALQVIDRACKKGFVISDDTDISDYIGFLHKIDHLMVRLDNPLDGSDELTNTLINDVAEMRKLVVGFNEDIQFSISGNISTEVVKPLFRAGIAKFVIGRHMLDTEDYYSLIADIRKQTKSA
ncbi:ribulose-phosphate 3-epimerase (plasmid) [Maricurvus nonylphenolicus]|uniref:hypothetical protein n=1 Tax=Maricurvus nonylphenolicus TaxID=1008307 RepID=UPI0036F21B92